MTRFLTLWTAAGLLLAFFLAPLSRELWVAAVLPHIFWLVSGGGYLLVKIFQARRATDRRKALTAAALTVLLGLVVALLTGPLWRAGGVVDRKIYWARHKSEYAAAIEELTRGIESPQGIAPRAVDVGPPLLAEFLYGGAPVLGEWCSIVYDSELAGVQNVNSRPARWSFAPRGVHCEELDPSYFHCCFSDD